MERFRALGLVAAHRMAPWWLACCFLLLWLAGWPLTARAQDADCAEVKIVIEQKLSLERQAFDARMVIRNGMDASALGNVRIELTYLDQNQQPVAATTDPNAVGAVFFQRTDQITGLGALDGSASIAPKSTADVHWLIIPAQGAGGDTASGRMYYVGAKVTYTLDGETTTVEVTPDYVVVRPQPSLALDYFLPGDVYGDDPFTPETEPPVPFTLGVRILNAGAGISAKTSIESAQPKIVENKQGLLIDFQILGGYVGNAMQGKSLLLDFGDIPGQQARMGRWAMQTSLSGRFTEFDASYTHADSLGGAVTSLVQGVRTHRLVHDVLIDLPGHDDVLDFLAEAGSDVHVYDSLGGDASVADVSRQAGLASASGGKLRLTFAPSPGLVHAKVADPHGGALSIARVVRSDGKVLPPQNHWLSKTRNADLSWSHFLHIFDSGSTGDYTLEFAQGGTSATLSGLAYRDANGNGTRDAGEAAEGNLAVTLKGVDGLGRNVLVTAHTGVDGAFSFTGLAPGRYQLEAASVSGWIDGAWAAGSAGGTAQPGAITDIVLAAGTAAQGYWIAKRRPQPDTGETAADLSIALKAVRAQLHAGETTTVTATVRNLGEGKAQSVAAQVAVPAGLSLQGSAAALGSYASGTWNIGDLAKGQEATLTLTVKADAVSGGKDAAISWPASVASQTPDPQMANNSALLGITVAEEAPAQFGLTQSLSAHADVLMLVSCPSHAAQEQAACESGLQQQAHAQLAARVRHLAVVSDAAAWRTALRGGRYNLLWLHAGAGKLGAQQLAEVRAAVRRGATLVIEGAAVDEEAGQPRSHHLDDVLGARLVLPSMGSGQPLKLPGEALAQATAGPLHALEALAPGAVVLAQGGSGDQPVMVSHRFGLGQAWLAGFDVLQTLQGPAAAFWDGFLNQRLQAMTPAGRGDPALAGARLALRTAVENMAPASTAAQDVSLRIDIPDGVAHENATPAPSQAQPRQVRWNMRLAPGQTQAGEVTLVLPQASSSLRLQATLLDAMGQQVLATQDMPVQTVGLDTLAPQTTAALAALAGAEPQTLALIQQARDAAAAANAGQQAQPPDWDAALTALASLQSALRQLAQPPHGLALDALQLDAARWMGLAQARWQPGMDTDTGAAQILVQSGAGQSARVGTAFGAPLVAKVVDGQGNPVAGALVRFRLPEQGPGAVFEALAQDVATDAQGLAQSPALTANATVGSYHATASVEGVAQAARFALTNLPASTGPVPAALRLVSGMGQATQAGSAFAAPLSVQALDASGLAVPGASVEMAFADAGPSATFAGGLQRIMLVTDALGMATSPLFTANAVPGTHQARITAAGAATVLTADLANLPLGSAGKQFDGTTATGTGAVQAQVSGGGDACAFNPLATRMVPPEGVWTPLQKFLLPHGLFDFELVGCQPGSEVTVSVTWPDLRGMSGYLKYGQTPASRGRAIWYVPSNLRIQGNTVTYTIRDGGVGDDDLVANGTIRDPSGPAQGDIGMDDGSALRPIPGLAPWAVALLSCVLAWMAVAGWRGRWV